jgi:hypothetical protein
MFDDSFKGNSSVGVITVYYKVRRSKSRTRDMQKASAVFTLFSCLTQSTPSLGEDNLCVYLFASRARGNTVAGAKVCSALARIKGCCKEIYKALGGRVILLKVSQKYGTLRQKTLWPICSVFLGAGSCGARDGGSLEFEMTSLMRCE